MGFLNDFAKMAGIVLAILQTRVELAAVELQEGAQRLLLYFVLVAAALFCAVLAFLLGIFLIIVLFWDTWRIGVICVLVGVFTAATIAIVLGLRSSIRNRPGLLAYTRAELASDIERLRQGR